jgi:hypothetical protein
MPASDFVRWVLLGESLYGAMPCTTATHRNASHSAMQRRNDDGEMDKKKARREARQRYNEG